MPPAKITRWTLVTTLLLTGVANAEDLPAIEEEAPPPPVVLKHIPPRWSWDVALHPSYGMLPQFIDAPAWMGLGVRGEVGRHFKNHRVGAGLGISLEGAIAVQWANNFEPQMTWDWVGEKHLWVGASIGPDLIINSEISDGGGLDNSFMAAPMVAARIGFSQPWSLLMRRFFIGVEPKFRWVDGQPAVLVAVVLGSGMGF